MKRQRDRILIASVIAGALALTACSSSDPKVAPQTTVAGGGGWIGGEPTWHGGGDGSVVKGVELDRAMPPVAAATTAPVAVAASAPGAALPTAAPPELQSRGPLRAGNVDDNADYDGFLAYLDRLQSAGVALRDLDPRGRAVITVIGSNDLPAAGAEVVVSQGGAEKARLRTTADGTARILPALYGASIADPLEIIVEGQSTTVDPGAAATVKIDRAGGVEGAVPLDLLFLLDATGSMGDEIDQLKATIDTVAERLAGLDPQPDLRLAMTLYRDEGDTFVTSTYDFTGDVAEFRAALAEVQADGGGDYPEAVDEALAAALGEPSWRDPATTVQMIFLVADAPPQIGRQVQQSYPESVKIAQARGIKISPIASSESDDQAEGVFRQIAQATGARFVFLSYGAAGAATGANTDINTTDYEELSLDDLVVRLVTEELDSLTGSTTVTPTPEPTPPTPSTNPPGQ